MPLKADVGGKFDRARIERILALSLELSDYELSQLITKLQTLKHERDAKFNGDNQETISL